MVGPEGDVTPCGGTALRLSPRRLSVPVWSLSPRYLRSALRYIAECEGIVTGGTTLLLQKRNKISDDDAYHAGNVLCYGRSRSAAPNHRQAFHQGGRVIHRGLKRGLRHRLIRGWRTTASGYGE